MAIIKFTATSLSQFLSNAATLIGQVPSSDQSSVILWRGQGDEKWPLEPFIQRVWGKEPAGLLPAEARMFEEFSAAAPYLLPTGTTNDWDKLSIAQHYGMATRLLDWTLNPLVALWFALARPRRSDAVVWFFRPLQDNMAQPDDFRTNPFKVEKTKVFRPMTHSSRVAMQAGWHTIHKFRSDGKGLWAIDEMKTHQPYLGKVVVPAVSRVSLFVELENSGVSVASVFGDLASLCNFVSNRNSPSAA